MNRQDSFRWDRWIPVALFALAIISRLPFRSAILHHWDSVNFALAIEHFDIRLHQPHPPGTFVLYILLGRLFNLMLKDSNASLVWISMLASGFSAALIFHISRHWFGRSVGLAAALLMIASPLIWFHGEVALSYMLEFAWVLLIVWLCDAVLKGKRRAVIFLALAMGLAGGIRPNTPVFLFPLWVFTVYRVRISLRELVVSLILMGVGVAFWAVPMLLMSGGPMEYYEIMQWWSSQHLEQSEEANPLVYTLRFGTYTVYALGLALVAILACVIKYWRKLLELLLRDKRAQILLFWTAPATIYFTLIHLKQPGHTFTLMPAWMIIGGLALILTAREWFGKRPAVQYLLVGGVVLINGLAFMVGPAQLLDSSRSLLTPPTRATIDKFDTEVSLRLEAIRERFPAEETTIIAGTKYFRLPDYYLQDYQLKSLSHQLPQEPQVLPDQIRTLVLFDETAFPELQEGAGWQRLSLPDGDSLRYLSWSNDEQVKVSLDAIQVLSR